MSGFRLTLILLLSGTSSVWSQTSTSTTGWYQYFGDHPITERWGIHAEGQWRRDNVITGWEQLLLRTGANYKVNEHISATLGYTYLRTFLYGDRPRDPSREHRIYQELKLKHRLRSIDWEHRFRLEQRFIAQEQEYKWRFGDRARYRLQARIPLRARRVENSSVYLSFYEEFFARFGPHGGTRAFDQNRAYGALGINLKGQNKLEIGYLYRYFPPSGGVARQEHALQLSIFSNSRLFRRP